MRRRQFITLFAAWPLVARAQQPEQVRRIGVLMNVAADDREGQTSVAAFRQALQQLGWIDGRNVQIHIRWGENDVDRDHKYAKELVALAPDVTLAAGSLSVAALQRVTRNLPIVFVRVADPVGAGFVDTLARPGGNTTGFMLFEYSESGKWLELLKQIAPQVTRALVIRDAANPAGIGQFSAIQAAAQSLGVEVSPVGLHDASEIACAVTTFARKGNGGLVVTPAASISVHRDLVIALAAEHKLPAVYAFCFDTIGGGLISYGPEPIDLYRRAADYINRILKGGKPTDLPVQAPTKYELVINRKTAKAIGLKVPASLLARADEVIE
jgi:putative ABC transport system substrate-binding protein